MLARCTRDAQFDNRRFESKLAVNGVNKMAHQCTCQTPVTPGSTLDIATRGVSHVIGARIDQGTARAIVQYCSRNRCTQSQALRAALQKLAKSSGDPDAQLASVREALGLEPDA